MISQIISKIREQYDLESFNNEDRPVLEFIDKLPLGHHYKFLEVGSGKGRFVKKILRKGNLKITCLEINKDLARMTSVLGVKTHPIDFIKSRLHDHFDIVHCSHFIEHFKYPEIAEVLEKLFAYTKKGGYVIIRSPLIHKNFYLDIDHFRPYPPETILNFSQNIQQQRVAGFKIEEISRWYRRPPLQLSFWANRVVIQVINAILLALWVKSKKISGKPDGYVSIFRKI